MNVNPSFDVIAEAGMSQADFAKLVQVSRVTVNTWVTGKRAPHASLRARVVKALKLIAAEVAAGRLPIDTKIVDRMHNKQLANIESKLTRKG